MVFISRNRIPGKYTKANFLYHWGRITAKVFKKIFETTTMFEIIGIPFLD